jgi:hypothetical protein
VALQIYTGSREVLTVSFTLGFFVPCSNSDHQSFGDRHHLAPFSRALGPGAIRIEDMGGEGSQKSGRRGRRAVEAILPPTR